MQITVEKSANDNKAQVKSPKIVTVENPYFIKEENEAVIEQKENEAAIAELQAKLEHYQKLSIMSNSIKNWVLAMNAIVIPIIIGVSFSVFMGSSNSKPSFADYAAAVSSKASEIRDR